MLKGKNCVIIASPEVNPLTEMLLGKLYEVEKGKWFRTTGGGGAIAGCVVAFKEADFVGEGSESRSDDENEAKTVGRAFYDRRLLSKPRTPAERLKRGFMGHGVPEKILQGEFISQKSETGTFKVHAHLVIARNPFDDIEGERHHVIILNGVSGPATFALTHMLTGGRYKYPVCSLPRHF